MTISESTIGVPANIGGILKETDSSATVDNVFVFESDGRKWRIIFDGGVNTYRASWLKIATEPTDFSSRLLIALDDSNIKEISLDTPLNINSTVDFNGKILRVTKGGSITGNGTIQNVVIDAPATETIFSTTLTVTTPISTTGKFSTKWWGVVADGNDISTALNKCVTSVNTSNQKSIIFTGSSVNYVLNTNITIPSSIIYSFENGAVLSGSGIFNGGIIDAGYRQKLFDPSFVVNPTGFMSSWASVIWFGADPTNVIDSQPAIQATVDMINRNRTTMTVCYIPGGIYKCNDSIALAYFNTNANRYEQVYILLKGEGEGYSSKFPAKGTRLIFSRKDKPALWWQIGKSGGAQSLAIEGGFVPPSMTAAQFYNSDLNSYTDPLCRDTRYSPMAGIAIDAVKYSGVPEDGGYPGLNYNAPGNTSTSGSSGLSFKDLKITGFTVAMIFSPNGQTQNDDAITVESIKIDNTKIGFASCQDQEKGNIFKQIVSWGVTHTIFDNITYGIGTSGHIIIDGVNAAGLNNQFINWSTGGRFPCYIRDVYSETLGKFGTIITSASEIVVSDSIWRWCYPSERGNYFADWHISANRGVVFKGCSFMTYGLFLPTIIRNSGANDSGAHFSDCYFDNYPSHFVEQAQGGAVYSNCYTTGGSRFGLNANINAQLPSCKSWIAYGLYTINDITSPPSNIIVGKAFVDVNGSFVYRQVVTGSNVAVVIQPDRTAVLALSTANVWYHKVNTPVYLGSTFAGLVSSVNTGGGTLTLKNIPSTIIDGNYAVVAMCPNQMYGFMGNTTAISNQITSVRTNNDFGISVGDIIYHSVFGGTGVAVVTNISGSSTTSPGAILTMNINSSLTTTGAYFAPQGVSKRFLNPSYNSIGGSFAATAILPANSPLQTAQFGYITSQLVTKTGFVNAASASDTRQAEFCVISLPTVVDRFVPGDSGKPANGATTYQNEILKGTQLSDWKIWFGNDLLFPNLSGTLSYTFAANTGTITITNGAFNTSLPVTIGK